MSPRAPPHGASVAYKRIRFLLACLLVDSLLDKNTKKRILSALNDLPKGSKAIDEAYDDALHRINCQLHGNQMLARSVLSWVTYAQRPLSTEELCHALAVEPGESEVDLDNIPDIEDIVSVCAGLVTVDDASNIIRFVHYTTQEYFERIRESWNPRAQHEIATACLTYLSHETFASGASKNSGDFQKRIKENPFFRYAATNWARHIFTIQEEVSQMALLFLQDEALLTSTSQMLYADDHLLHYLSPYHYELPESTTGLHLTARFGLLHLSKELLNTFSETVLLYANSQDTHDQTPLMCAAFNGHEEVVKLLLAQDDVEADLKSRLREVTALSEAVFEDNEAVVRLLLARDDVEVNSKDCDGLTPLSWTARYGNEAVVRLLLARDDVEADSKDGHGRTPLTWSTCYGNEAVVRLLLARDDVEVNSKDCDGLTPLSWAARYGHEAIVRLLLARDDVEADSKDTDGRTPLSWSAGRGHEAIVRLLLARDNVEADSKDSDGRTPLSWSACHGHEAITRLLLARDDVKADSKDRDRRTPLTWSACHGHEAIVRLLLA